MRARITIVIAGVLGVAACVPPPPPGPTVSVMPGQGKNYAQFQQEDGYCRTAAERGTNGVSPGQAAAQNGVGSAVVGTGIGAVAGALLGSVSGHAGAGAAIGAGSGLLLGSAVGAGNAQAAGNSVQHQYNVVYAQCMSSYGNSVDRPRRYGPPPGYYQPGPYDGPPPPGY